MKKKITIVIIVCFFIIIYIIRVLNLNNNAFHVKKEMYEMGEICSFNDFQYKILDCEVMDEVTLKNRYDVEYKEEIPVAVDYIVTTMEITYIGEKETADANRVFYQVSGAWTNGGNTKLKELINKDGFEVKRGQTKVIRTVTNIVEPQLSKKEWKDRYNRKYEIYLSTLPKEVVLKCY